MEWSYFHAYRHLAEEGKVNFLSCPDCSSKLTTMMDKHDSPSLWCPVCNKTITPGLYVYDQIKAVVNEQD